jgi:DNA mismatch repair protein MutL
MERDGHIRILPIHVANKIAAGEVVERPASALKELIENAVDAGADRIDISATAGGRKLVSVRDNGCGMGRDDALLSLERQATSKIRDVDDIERIDTLGFRGEAIPSIAAVSRFTLVTRRKEDEAGTRIVVNAGTIAEVADCGAPPGTCVEVRDLFCNVPARKKFLRSYATEEGHIKSVFTVCALAHPELGFSLNVDGRELHRFAPGATLEERIAALFGRDFADELVAIGDESGGIAASVHGYVSLPSQNPVRREQFVFVNGRPATAPIIAYAIKEAYPSGHGDSRPSLFLFIEVPPSDVDVNVHPSKREVRFRHPADVKAAIIAAVAKAFNRPAAGLRNVQAERKESAAVAAPAAAETTTPTAEPVAPAVFSAPFQPTLPKGGEPRFVVPEGKADDIPSSDANPKADEPATPPPMPQAVTGPWRSFKVLAATESGYLILETDAGLVTLNPQAAQERIAFERLMAAFDAPSGAMASQPLLLPETVHFSPLESARLKSYLPILLRQGFDLEEFGTDTWKIDAVPSLLEGRNATAVIASVVYDSGEAGMKRGDRWREELIARSVARSYAGAPRKFTVESATKLVEDLCRTKMPYVCPRGKPVMIFTSNRELSRKFGG